MEEIKSQKPQDLGPNDVWFEIDKERKRLLADLPSDSSFSLIDDKSGFLFVVANSRNEVNALGLLEQAKVSVVEKNRLKQSAIIKDKSFIDMVKGFIKPNQNGANGAS